MYICIYKINYKAKNKMCFSNIKSKKTFFILTKILFFFYIVILYGVDKAL